MLDRGSVGPIVWEEQVGRGIWWTKDDDPAALPSLGHLTSHPEVYHDRPVATARVRAFRLEYPW